MANNQPHPNLNARWSQVGSEPCDCDIEIFVIRKDKAAIMMERELPIPPEYVRVMLAALIDLPAISIKKITVSVDGSLLS